MSYFALPLKTASVSVLSCQFASAAAQLSWLWKLNCQFMVYSLLQRPMQPPTAGGLSWWLWPLRGGHGRGLRRFAAVMAEVFAPSWWSRRRSFIHRHKNNAKKSRHMRRPPFSSQEPAWGLRLFTALAPPGDFFGEIIEKKKKKAEKKPPPLAVGGGHVAVFAAPPWRSRRSFADTAGGLSWRSFLVFQFGG